MIEAKFFTVGTYLYKYNLTVLFVSPSKIAHDKFYIYCPPLLLNEIYAHVYIYIYIYIYIYKMNKKTYTRNIFSLKKTKEKLYNK